MHPYEHGSKYYDATIKYDLSENINPLGMPEDVIRVIISCPEAFSRYPDAEYSELREKIARLHGVCKDNICLGNGADELIWKLVEVYRPGRVLIPVPTFSEYERSAKAVSAVVTEYKLSPANCFSIGDGFLDILEQGFDMVFLCNPNNPTGKIISDALLQNIIAKARNHGTKVVVDESFLDFTMEKSLAGVVEEYDNLIIIRGFTKIYGMAGIRLGYMVAGKEHVYRIRKYGPIWNVSAVAMLAGQAALSDSDWINKSREFIQKEKAYIIANIPEAMESDANFILIKTGKDMADKLYSRGIAVRKCQNFSGLDESYIRVGIKTHECNEAFVNAYKEIING